MQTNTSTNMKHKQARRTTVEKYRKLIFDVANRKGPFNWPEAQSKHSVATCVGTTLRRIGYIIRHGGGGNVIWAGPRPESINFLDFADRVVSYREETRKNAPSVVMRGSRQERRERNEKFQGWRSDLFDAAPLVVQKKSPKKTVSILWGLITWER